MNTTVKIIMIVFGVLIIGVILLGAGFVIGRFSLNRIAWTPMHFFDSSRNANQPADFWGPGMMGQFGGQRMAWNEYDCSGRTTFHRGGMMGQWRQQDFCGQPGQGHGMMWEYDTETQASVEVLSVEQAEEAVNSYLSQYGDPDLVLAEVMIFDNHAYAEIIEESTGIGAMEVLIDPVTLSVSPEYGPNMMWNQKYGHMRGGMMGGIARPGDVSADMTISENQAVQAAQAYLDAYKPGLQADDHAAPFYGYYTLHTMQNGEVIGMLSVNGYSGDVFLHAWHGEFVEMVEFGEGGHD